MSINVESDEHFEQLYQDCLLAKSRMVVDFTATWCGPCRRIKPLFASAQQRFADQAVFVIVDIDECEETRERFNVSSIPTIVLIEPGDGDDMAISQRWNGSNCDQLIPLLSAAGLAANEDEDDKQAPKIDDDVSIVQSSTPSVIDAPNTSNVIVIEDDEQWVQVADLVAARKLPTLVQFSATWCGPCKRMYPIVDQLSVDHEQTMLTVRVDVDGAPNVAQAYQVSAVPLFIMFDRTGTPVQQFSGADERALRNLIAQHI